MLCSVSVSAHNIVTLLLAWRDCQNGTLDSINSVHPPLPTHVQAHTYNLTYTHAQVYVHAHTLRDTHARACAHTHTHTHTHTHKHMRTKHTVSHHSMFIPMVTQCNHGN